MTLQPVGLLPVIQKYMCTFRECLLRLDSGAQRGCASEVVDSRESRRTVCLYLRRVARCPSFSRNLTLKRPTEFYILCWFRPFLILRMRISDSVHAYFKVECLAERSQVVACDKEYECENVLAPPIVDSAHA